MNDMLPKHVREGLEQARKRDLRRKSRLRVRVGDEVFPILRMEEDGFTLDAENAPHLRGNVDIYEGQRHLCQALIVASALEGDEMSYEFKRQTAAVDAAPLDYSRDENAPVALIGKD
ncbi:hypothetical protein ACQ5SP_10300 [Rhodovulum sp. YNF3179]|uniref:hypothetical protein n=1 Tax=Rhodovulum sp. YNF3179 TaxID=3425127 RepID=UPI003D34B08D